MKRDKLIRTLSEELAENILKSIATCALRNSITKYDGEFELVAQEFEMPLGQLRIALAYLFAEELGIDMVEVVRDEIEKQTNENS